MKIIDISNSNFDDIAVVRYEMLDLEGERLKCWLSRGMEGELEYMRRSADLRRDPRAVFADVKSIIVTLTAIKKVKPHSPTLAAFAHNNPDYHILIKNKLNLLLSNIREIEPQIEGRAVVDSAPIFEKGLAVRAGLGWIGRNSLLIHPRLGSYTHIGLLLLNKDLSSECQVIEDQCPKGCSICKDNCPNGAINGDRTVDCRKCIAAMTIENCSDAYALHNHIFGCDLCQQYCPYNSDIEEIEPTIKEDWSTITKDSFRAKYRKTSLGRVSFEKIKNSLQCAKNQ